MTYLVLYAVTVVVFLGLDVVMLKKVMYPMFSSNIGSMMLDSPKMGPAAAFYLFYVGGVLWFASIPALQSGQPSHAFVAGFVLGLLAFGTYEFTNFATLRGWVIQMVAVDVVWGGVLTGTSAWVGVSVVKAFL
jgi:uncharacterized membrane protein